MTTKRYSPITVTITQDDIDQGVPRSLWRDALCLALNRQTKKQWITDGVSILCPRTNEAHHLPIEARLFVERESAGQKNEPIAFTTLPGLVRGFSSE